MDVSLVLQFAAIAALLTLIPGADWAYVISAGARSRSAVPPVLGLASGYVVVVAAVAVGVGALVASRPDILTLLTVVGACYILYLGISTLLSLRSPASATLVPGSDSRGAVDGHSRGLSQYIHGMGISGINPKGLMLLLALLPQYLTPHGWSSTVQTGLLGGIFVLEVLVIYFIVAVFSRSLLHGRPRLNTAVTVVSGVFLTGFGAWLLLAALVF